MLGSVSEQMPWAGAAVQALEKQLQGQEWGWNKGRGPSPSCSVGCVMSSSGHELARGTSCIRAPYGTSFPMFAVTPRAGSESQAAGTCRVE